MFTVPVSVGMDVFVHILYAEVVIWYMTLSDVGDDDLCVCGHSECSLFVPVCVKSLLSSMTLPAHSFAELVDLIRGGLKKESEVNRWQT